MADLNKTSINDSGFIKQPVGTQGQRINAQAGQMRINSTKNVFEWNNSIGWKARSDWVINDNYRDAPPYTPHVLIQVESQGLNNLTGAGRRQFIQIDGTTVVSANSPRSYRMTKLRKDANGFWTFVDTNGYDVYGLTSEANNAKAYLETFQEGEMLILNTYDEPNRNSSVFADVLQNKFGSKIEAFRSSGQLSSRDSRLLVSICGSKIPLFEQIKPSPQPGITMSMWIP